MLRQHLLRLLLLCSFAWAAAAFAQPAAPRIVVVADGETAPYQAAVAEISALARASGTVVLRPAGQLLSSALQMGTLSRSDVFVALGARTTAQVQGLGTPVQAMSCLTIERTGLPGVVLTHSAAARIELLKRIVPKASKIGVLYDPAGSRTDLAALVSAATAVQATIVARPVTDAASLAMQLERLANEVDVLLATYDQRIYSAKNAAPLIRFSYQHRIPLLGMSESWARAGALAGIDWDYRELAEQCAAKAVRLAAGERIEAEPKRPTRMPYAINAATARELGVTLPAAVAQGARQVFE